MKKRHRINKTTYPFLLIYEGWFYWHRSPDRKFYASQNLTGWATDNIGPFKSLRLLKDHIDQLSKES
jgi:hypothetical protein